MDSGKLASFLHEIRTPIQTILGTADFLRETNLDAEQQEYVRQISFSADILHTLVNDILDFEKIKGSRLRLESIPCDVQSIAEQALDLVSIEAYNKGLELVTCAEGGVPEQIYGDPVRLLQILVNIVKNAVKFTAAGHILITIGAKSAGGRDFLSVRVADTGIGIPDERKKDVFSEYVQEDASTARRFGGTGLGLSICRELVLLMGGAIGVEDNPGGGSVFWFTLPLRPVRPGAAKVPEALSCAARVLVVDDSPAQCAAMTQKLLTLGAGYAASANSGEEALQKLEAACDDGHEFNLVLIDMSMPVMDGWRLASAINANKRINGARLCLMVPEGQLGGEAKMKMLHWFNGYLYKPVKFNKLRELLQKAMDTPLELEEAEAQAGPAEDAPSANTGGSPRPSVLAVDDHPVNLAIMEKMLASLGCDPLWYS